MDSVEFLSWLKTGIGFKVLNREMILLTHNWIIENKSRILCVGIVAINSSILFFEKSSDSLKLGPLYSKL